MIHYFLYRSRLNNLAGKYAAQLTGGQNIGTEFLAKVVAESGLTASSSEVRAILDRTREIIIQQLLLGNTVSLEGLCTLRPSIAGTFPRADAPFDASLNHVAVSVTADKRLRKEVRLSARVERVGHARPMPTLVEVRDVATDSRNRVLTPGGIGQLNGDALRFDRADGEQGLFIAAEGMERPLAVTALQKATDKEIVFLTPTLEPAMTSVYLMLRSRRTPDGPLITGKSMTLDVAIT